MSDSIPKIVILRYLLSIRALCDTAPFHMFKVNKRLGNVAIRVVDATRGTDRDKM